MPSALVKRINLDLIYPPFLEKFLALIAKAKEAGQDYYAVSGMRSFEEQAYKYSLGRTRPGARITNAQPGYSLHNYGLAVDCARDDDLNKPGLQTNWDSEHGQYDLLRDSALGTGLQVGVPTVAGGDKGHIQVHVQTWFKMPEVSLLYKMRNVYVTSKVEPLKAVWAYLDSLSLSMS